jgi:hypothetical protein
MANLRTFLQSIPTDYPSHLAASEPERKRYPPALWLLVGLVILCLAPRTMMALKTKIICPDGVLYITLAQALNEGDIEVGLREMRLNTLPVVLVGLHRLGLDWDVAGKLWGVLISSLVVLPMYGWARRQFDDRVALVACVLYAVHANVIEWSPELIRGPTFWFLFMLSIYLLWRAVTEVRVGFFLAVGGAITLASLTRVEGLFLFIPLVLWTAWRCLALRTARWKLLLGAGLGAVFFPALLLLVNLTWLRGHPRWESVRSTPLHLAQTSLKSMTTPSLSPSDKSGQRGERTRAQMSQHEMAWLFVHTMERGLTPLFALLMFGGNLAWRRVWWRRDTWPLTLVALAVAGGIWIHLGHAHVSSHRYPIPLVLMGSPFAALGLLGFSAWMLRLAGRLRFGRRLQFAVAALPLVVVSTVGLADALTKDYAVRESRARLGHWIRHEFGVAPSLLSFGGSATTIAYYAQGQCLASADDIDDDSIRTTIQQFHPDVVLLLRRHVTPKRERALARQLEHLGFGTVDSSKLPPGAERVLVLARTREDLLVTQGPAAVRLASAEGFGHSPP